MPNELGTDGRENGPRWALWDHEAKAWDELSAGWRPEKDPIIRGPIEAEARATLLDELRGEVEGLRTWWMIESAAGYWGGWGGVPWTDDWRRGARFADRQAALAVISDYTRPGSLPFGQAVEHSYFALTSTKP